MTKNGDVRGQVLVTAFAALSALAALSASCKIEGERRSHRAIGPDAAALREAFNADAGKVRLIVLVAPT